MIIIISPSKTLDFKANPYHQHSQPRQLEHSQKLINVLKRLNPEEIAHLMKISEKLSQLNWQRYREFKQPFTLDNAKQALLAFKGDVYKGIKVDTYSADDFTFAQKHLRILSGLYGLLRPLDLIQPYRLEMGSHLQNEQGRNLYEFWHDQVTVLLNQDFKNQLSPVLINLASNEYYKVIKPKILNAKVLTLTFKENKSGIYKTIAIYAKRARGLMTDFIITHRITEPEQLKTFNQENYRFNPSLSSKKEWVFSR